MFRAGYSWPTGQGGRTWVSGPAVLMLGVPCMGQLFFWLFIGWWLLPAWWGLLLTGWLACEAALLIWFLIMSISVLIGSSKGKHYKFTTISYHVLIAPWWTQQGDD
jgi:hypothetical protein